MLPKTFDDSHSCLLFWFASLSHCFFIWCYRLPLGRRCSIPTSTATEVFALTSWRSNGVLLSPSPRFCLFLAKHILYAFRTNDLYYQIIHSFWMQVGSFHLSARLFSFGSIFNNIWAVSLLLKLWFILYKNCWFLLSAHIIQVITLMITSFSLAENDKIILFNFLNRCCYRSVHCWPIQTLMILWCLR